MYTFCWSQDRGIGSSHMIFNEYSAKFCPPFLLLCTYSYDIFRHLPAISFLMDLPSNASLLISRNIPSHVSLLILGNIPLNVSLLIYFFSHISSYVSLIILRNIPSNASLLILSNISSYVSLPRQGTFRHMSAFS